ncbi:zinc finger protein 638-like isoform X5 [Narcine bancroftii]|uniref:zinc finger protein 638-like isoform X5 n=1 Tax=Narcine bancroftii TaxID=1343680 RepID=UPI0038318711
MAVAAQAQLGAYPSAGSAIDCGACVTAAVASAAAAFDSEPLRGRQRPEERVRRERGVVVSAGGVGGSFALFLENCAPAVNSLNLGITSPLLLGSANLQLAQIKAQLALQQLNSVASSTVSNTALASLNQALVKINMSMFNARGAFGQSRGPPNQYGQSQGPPNQYGQSQGPVNQYGLSQGPANQYGQSQGPPSQYGQSQGPPSQYGQSQCPPSQFGQSQGPPSQFGQSQGPPSHFGKTQVPPNQFQNQGPPNQFAMNTPGPYMGGGVGGTGRGMGMGAQGTSQGNFGMGMGMMNQPGSNVGLGQWSSYQSPSSGGYRPGYGNTATPSSQSGEQRSAVQLFHDTMKATNILANFGLSNEDLEELSRYPDEKLTPENMPYILREIRMRKMNKQQASSSYDQAHKLQDKDYRREVQSSVVDYGHGQQYDYRDRPMENQSMHYSRETLREGTWKEDFKRPPQNYPLESSRDESTHTIKRTVQVVKKGLPKPKLMNDYYGVPALRFPHVCSLCNIECRQMRDWDRHNKTSVHNDSCRLLLKEYPDWDPDAVPPTKEELAKKEKEAAAAGQATPSFSTARISPKHLSPRRMSPHRTSPRRSSPHKPSPRHLSPRKNSPRRFSPHRSRSSPRRSSPYRSRSSPRHASPYRSRSSPRRMSPHRSRPRRLSPHKSRSSPPKSSPRKPNPKHKSQKEMPAKNSNQKAPVSQLTNQKPPNQKIMKQPAKTSKSFAEAKRNAGPAASSALAEKPAAQQEANAQQMNEMRKSERVVRVTDLPHDGYTEEDLSKLTQPFGKVTSIKLVRSKNEAFLKMAYKEAAEAVVEFYSITPAEINRRQVTMMLLGQKKEMVKQDQKEQLPSQAAPSVQKDKDTSDTNAKPPATSEDATPATDAKMSGDESSSVHKPQSEDDSLNDKGRVIRISNLPAKGYTEDDLKSLAKPFGQVLNVVITFSRNQAYLEMACTKAATKMVEFYSLSTIKLKGNAISMEILHQYLDLSDMEVIFKDIIEESGFKPDAGCTIYDHLVHISNLPEDGYTEVDILWVAFRFGRVKDSMFLKPHNKVLIHLESGNAATSMCSFFREIPHDFHGKTLEFSLSPHAGIQPEPDFSNYSPTGFLFDSLPIPQRRSISPQRKAQQGPNSQPCVEPSSGGDVRSISKEANPWWGRSQNSIQFMPLPRTQPSPHSELAISEKSTFESILSGTRGKCSSELLRWAGGPLKGSLDDRDCRKPMIKGETPLECHILLPLAFRLPLSMEHLKRLRFHVGIPDVPAVVAPKVNPSLYNHLALKNVVSNKKDLDMLLGVVEATRSIQWRVTESVSPLILAAQNFELDKLQGVLGSLSPYQLKEKLLSMITACRMAVVLAGQTHTFLSELRSDRLLQATGMARIAPSPLDFPNLTTADLLGPQFLDDLTCRMVAAKQNRHKPAAAKNLSSFRPMPQKRKPPPSSTWPQSATRGKKARR